MGAQLAPVLTMPPPDLPDHKTIVCVPFSPKSSIMRLSPTVLATCLKELRSEISLVVL